MDSQVKRLRARPLYQDLDAPSHPLEIWAQLHTADLIDVQDVRRCGFKGSATLELPFLVDLPVTSAGAFTSIVVDIYAPLFPTRPDYICEVEFSLRGKLIDKKTFRNYTQRHQVLVSCQLLREQENRLDITIKMIMGGDAEPVFHLSVFYTDRDRMLQVFEQKSIMLFSTARSGSTWLSHDVLCWNGRTRPMDEPGLGRMFAPLDWGAERFYNIQELAHPVESGFAFEMKHMARKASGSQPPFERIFIYARQENQLWSAQNKQMLLGLVRETAFRHLMNEWGLIDYERIVFKLPNDSHAADIIMQALPGTMMILLMRDGRDVLKSRFSPFASRTLAETKDLEMRLQAVSFYAHFWNFQVDIMRDAFEAHAPERRIFARYEDLRVRPFDELRVIFDKLNMTISDSDLHHLTAKVTLENLSKDQKGPDKPRQTGQIGRYADVFSPNEIDLMNSIMGENLARYGYD